MGKPNKKGKQQGRPVMSTGIDDRKDRNRRTTHQERRIPDKDKELGGTTSFIVCIPSSHCDPTAPILSTRSPCSSAISPPCMCISLFTILFCVIFFSCCCAANRFRSIRGSTQRRLRRGSRTVQARRRSANSASEASNSSTRLT